MRKLKNYCFMWKCQNKRFGGKTRWRKVALRGIGAAAKLLIDRLHQVRQQVFRQNKLEGIST